jgi:AbrB family looped-hinge helix DNA binding protein
MQSKITINDRGVITIPAAIRQAFGLKANDELIVEDTDQGILLRPAISVPIEIYTDERIAEFASDEEEVGRILDEWKSKQKK